MSTIIDTSEVLPALTVNALSTTIVEKDAGSPPGPVVVHAGAINAGVLSTLVIQHATVDASGVNLALGSTVDVNAGGHLNIGGLAEVDVLSAINIDKNGTVQLGNELTLGALSTLNFIGTDATLQLKPGAEAGALSATASGEISGFGSASGQKIDFLKLAGVTHAVWTENLIQALAGNGQVNLLNAQNQVVGGVVLHGSYATQDFAVASDGHGGTNLTFV
ncbi:MAG: hypothetical protein JO047_06740 [Alphaproteobacteria bacterium]|nr:hypothetical protein [Alphaproteobacteria bacterium]